MTLGDGEQLSERSGTPPEDGVEAAQIPGSSPEGSTSDQPALPPVRQDWSPVQPGLPEAQPGQPPAPPSDWQPGQPPAPVWPQAQQGWPPAPSSDWQPGQPPAPPVWPQAQQGWPPAPPVWPPAPQSWPPAPTGSGFGDDVSYVGAGSSPRRRPGRLPQILVVVAAVLLAFSGGMIVDHLTVASQQQQQVLQNFDVYLQALQDIRNNYVGRGSLTDQQLLYGSIQGLVDSLGDTNHSRFMTADQYQQLQSQLSGKVAGIGILIVETNGTPTVERVIVGSPAEGAGVKAGDQITAVDGTSTAGMNFDQLAALIRGDVGTKVTITVIHAGSTTGVDLSMVRQNVSAPLVDWGIVPGTHVADIALFEFSDGASDQVQAAIDAAKLQGATAIVLDLRANPGGLADEARGVASEFLPGGVIYIDEDASGQRSEVTVDTSRRNTTLPMVVLVDAGTASAAEIVAGVLQDSHRAKVVGLTTVGTGTVLQPFVLSDGSVVLLGTSDWLTPSGHRIFGVGITPDETIAMPSGTAPIDPVNLEAMTPTQLQSSGDAELLAALKDLGQ